MQNPWISMQKVRKKNFFFEFSADVASYLSIAIQLANTAIYSNGKDFMLKSHAPATGSLSIKSA